MSTAVVQLPAENISGIVSNLEYNYNNLSLLNPVSLFMQSLEYIHLFSGLHWVSTIAAFTIGIRLLLYPLAVVQAKTSITSNNLKPDIDKLKNAAIQARSRGNSEEYIESTKKLSNLFSKNGINPLKLVGVSIVPIPFFMSTFFAIRNLCSYPIYSMKTDGILWFTDLTIPDPYFVLPALTVASLILTLEVFSLDCY